MDLSFNNIDFAILEHVSNIIKDGIEKINLCGCEFTNHEIISIAKKIEKFENPVNIYMLYFL